jgi:hypothetical protein
MFCHLKFPPAPGYPISTVFYRKFFVIFCFDSIWGDSLHLKSIFYFMNIIDTDD